MPVPIVCLENTLRQYAETFRGVFTVPQFQHFVTVLLGLVLAPERRTLVGVLSRVAGARSVSALSRFFAQAPWEPDELAQAWQARFRQQLAPQVRAEHARQRAQRPRRPGRPSQTRITTFAIFDDTTVAKHVQGKPNRCTAGVGAHYSAMANGVVQGHSLVGGLLVLLGRRCPLAPQLYRTRSVAQAEGVPFHSKVELVVSAIRTLPPMPSTTIHVLVDAWYTCQAVWQASRERGFAITGGLRINRWLRLPDDSQSGLKCKVRLSTYVAGLRPEDFVLVPWRGRLVAAHRVRTFVYKLGPCQLLVAKETLDAPPESARCWASSDLKGDVATIASYAAQRWDIETWFEDAKGLLGLDHYQLTSAEAIVRFWHLVACSYLYLDEVRARLRAQGQAEATIGAALRQQQRAQHHLLLQWLQQQFAQGLTVDNVEALLAA